MGTIIVHLFRQRNWGLSVQIEHGYLPKLVFSPGVQAQVAGWRGQWWGAPPGATPNMTRRASGQRPWVPAAAEALKA